MEIDVFWGRVKTLIKKKGVTQSEAAKACGIPPETFRGWMSKHIIPTVFSAYDIARYLGVSLEYLVQGRGTDRVSKTAEEVIVLLNKAEDKLNRIRG
jgi:transcriptional regulator with XRE-family HTH domain